MFHGLCFLKTWFWFSPAALGSCPTHRASLWVDQFPFAARATNLVLLFSLFVSWEQNKQKKIQLSPTVVPQTFSDWLRVNLFLSCYSCCWATRDQPFLHGLEGFLPSILHSSDHLWEHVVNLHPLGIQTVLKHGWEQVCSRVSPNKSPNGNQPLQLTWQVLTDELISAIFCSVIRTFSCKSALILSRITFNDIFCE